MHEEAEGKSHYCSEQGYALPSEVYILQVYRYENVGSFAGRTQLRRPQAGWDAVPTLRADRVIMYCCRSSGVEPTVLVTCRYEMLCRT